MIEALQKGDEVVTAGGVLGQASPSRRAVRDARDRAEHRDQRADARRCSMLLPKGTLKVAIATRPASNESLSRLEIRADRGRARARAPLHAAELLRRVAGGAGLERQVDRQGRRRAARRASRRRCKARASRYTGVAARRDRRAGALRRPRHAAQGQGRRSSARSTRTRRSRPTSSRSTCCRRSPRWLTAIARAADVPRPRPARRRALPAAGRHEGARSTKRVEALAGDIRAAAARQEHPPRRHRRAKADAVAMRFRDAGHARPGARRASPTSMPDLAFAERDDGEDLLLVGTLKPEALKRVQETALQQNITTLHNRVNELGVAEPVIQQQGADRIVVQLPGVQDTARAKDILGRTATLEVRLVDDEPMRAGHRAVGRDAVRHRAAHATAAARRCSSSSRSSLTGDQFIDAAARLRPGPAARRSASSSTAPAAASCATSRARTSASAWRSCCSRRARAR